MSSHIIKHIVNKIIISCIFVAIVLFLTCEGPMGPPGPAGSHGEPGPPGDQGPPGLNGDYDKQIRIPFSVQNFGATNTRGIISDSEIIRFSKAYYQKIDSIIFIANMTVSSNVDGATCLADIYNKTDRTIISNSLIETSSKNKHVWVSSKNLLADFPLKEIDLAIRVRSGNHDAHVHIRAAYLFIYRK